MSDFDDILGGEAQPVRRGGRPTNEERARRAEERLQQEARQADIRRAGAGKAKISPESLRDLAVSQNWLAEFFGMDPVTVRKRLAKCPVAGSVGGGRPVYIFQDAVPFIVKPKMDIATYLKTLNPTDMPPSINKTFWEAERIKNKVLVETGEAWHDSAVLAVLGRTFMLIKERIPIIVEGMREAGLTDEQSAELAKFCAQMQADLHEALVDMPKQHRTLARRAELDPYVDAEGETEDADEDE